MEQKEYIERDAALKAMDNLLHHHFLVVPDSATQAAATAGYKDGVKDADIRLRSISAADVRPIVRGHWERTLWFVTCSVCGYTSADTDDEGSDISLNFCPNCGADMREDVKE